MPSEQGAAARPDKTADGAGEDDDDRGRTATSGTEVVTLANGDTYQGDLRNGRPHGKGVRPGPAPRARPLAACCSDPGDGAWSLSVPAVRGP